MKIALTLLQEIGKIALILLQEIVAKAPKQG